MGWWQSRQDGCDSLDQGAVGRRAVGLAVTRQFIQVEGAEVRDGVAQRLDFYLEGNFIHGVGPLDFAFRAAVAAAVALLVSLVSLRLMPASRRTL